MFVGSKFLRYILLFLIIEVDFSTFSHGRIPSHVSEDRTCSHDPCRPIYSPLRFRYDPFVHCCLVLKQSELNCSELNETIEKPFVQTEIQTMPVFLY